MIWTTQDGQPLEGATRYAVGSARGGIKGKCWRVVRSLEALRAATLRTVKPRRVAWAMLDGVWVRVVRRGRPKKA